MSPPLLHLGQRIHVRYEGETRYRTFIVEDYAHRVFDGAVVFYCNEVGTTYRFVFNSNEIISHT